MGRNPLDDGEGGGGSRGTGGPMQPGDVHTIHAKDPKTGEIIKTFTLQRTARPYVYDLCDAYNAERSDAVIRNGGEWYVTPHGELKLGDSSHWTSRRTRELDAQAERDRQLWKQSQIGITNHEHGGEDGEAGQEESGHARATPTPVRQQPDRE